jgi:exodeoxyribonuclease V alpha subunit
MENYENEEKMLKRVERIARGYKEQIDKIEIYTPSKNPKFQTGAVAMNRSLQKILNCEDEDNSVTHGYYTFGIGDKVIFNRNSYDDTKNFYNGEGGVITSVQKIEGTNIVVVKAEDGAVIELRDEDLDAIDLGYAITAHKSQGGETETAIILVPQKPSSMLLRKLLYVEVTRAKKNVLILSEGDALKKCISSYMEIKRNTGLKDLLIS